MRVSVFADSLEGTTWSIPLYTEGGTEFDCRVQIPRSVVSADDDDDDDDTGDDSFAPSPHTRRYYIDVLPWSRETGHLIARITKTGIACCLRRA
jgi:hypothetical protein